jgi:hypothetical protein
LGVRTRQFFNESDVPLRDFSKHRRELKVHVAMIPPE